MPNSARVRPNSAQIGSRRTNIWQTSSKLARTRPKSCHPWANCGRVRSKVSQSKPNSGRIRLNVGRMRPGFSPNRSTSAHFGRPREIGTMLVWLGGHRAELGRNSVEGNPESVEAGGQLVDHGLKFGPRESAATSEATNERPKPKFCHGHAAPSLAICTDADTLRWSTNALWRASVSHKANTGGRRSNPGQAWPTLVRIRSTQIQTGPVSKSIAATRQPPGSPQLIRNSWSRRSPLGRGSPWRGSPEPESHLRALNAHV